MSPLRQTPVRLAMRRLFQETSKPVTATEVMAWLKRARVNVNRVTVYRDLEAFVEAGEIEMVDLGGQVRRYERRDQAHHHHIICESCHSIEDVQLSKDIEAAVDRVLEKTTFRQTRHTIEFFGICERCGKS